MKKLLVIVLTIGLAGCASHGVNLSDGTEKPAHDDAVIRTWSPGDGGLVTVRTVDGIERGLYTSHVYVRPGVHQLTVQCVNPRGLRVYRSNAAAPLNVAAKAGHTYIVSALPDFENKKVAYQVEDKGSQYDPSCLTPTRFAPNGLQGKNC
jgi:hypothetical protein